MFCQFFAGYLKSTSNFEHFEKKMTHIGYVFSKLETAKDKVSQMSKKLIFRTPCDSQHVKESEKLPHRSSITLFHHFDKN